jgi:hypothetical protein
MDECAYVDGVVFRKTVSHKKMMAPEISSHDENSASNQVHKQQQNFFSTFIIRRHFYSYFDTFESFIYHCVVLVKIIKSFRYHL